MDKGLENESSSSNGGNNRGDLFLKNLNRNSHRISKPMRKPTVVPILEHNFQNSSSQSQQPPVYNIDKNDFRDVVQKLTGSPAHDRNQTPLLASPTVSQTRPSSSRLQRIRPPPLPQIANRPPLTQLLPRGTYDAGHSRISRQIQGQMLLPPLPSVHTAAESPISAYMRFLQSSNSISAAAAPTSPLWNGVPSLGQNLYPTVPFSISNYLPFPISYSSSAVIQLPTPPQQQQLPSSIPFPALPLSPLPFGCAISPRFLFSPGLPSPTLPLPSPR